MDITIEVSESEETGERILELIMLHETGFRMAQEADAEEVRAFIAGLVRALACLEGGQGNL